MWNKNKSKIQDCPKTEHAAPNLELHVAITLHQQTKNQIIFLVVQIYKSLDEKLNVCKTRLLNGIIVL
ncbi:hypothetical protein DJ013_04855 [Arcticibacterium luteifluviistationis]|uniref:Uncharacterized protein n=1 Tax=Arcticibacterium luteifluviistationis TaxID=1784714 RepID=A0A2Z4G8I9_9BACT|nr:hypothetical protein DJ013_04855 [Arcticibacterium luteifluviistationis]